MIKMRKYMTPHWVQASQILPSLKRLNITRLLILSIIAHMVEWIILVITLLSAGEWFLIFWVQSPFSAGWFLLWSYWRQLSNHFHIWCIWPKMVRLDMSVQTPGQKSCVCLIGDLLGASRALKCLSRSVQTLSGLLMWLSARPMELRKIWWVSLVNLFSTFAASANWPMSDLGLRASECSELRQFRPIRGQNETLPSGGYFSESILVQTCQSPSRTKARDLVSSSDPICSLA